MASRLLLASGSEIRKSLLSNAGVSFEVLSVKIDEAAIRDSMLAAGARPRDIADKLADFKAQRAVQKNPDAMVIGCDQVLEYNGTVLGKPTTQAEAREQLAALSGAEHRLHSAAVIYDREKPAWRHLGTVKLFMRESSDSYLDDYVGRNWDSIRHSVGGYKLEEEGVRLFHRIEGDHFNVLGMPLLEILAYLTQREQIPG